MSFRYPTARRSDVEDDYHGTIVPDPYRWAEDPEHPETREFVRAQNAITMPYLASLPEVSRLRQRIEEVWDIPRTGAPKRRGGTTVWAHNDGLLDQPQFFMTRDGSEPELLLDPNTLSGDGAVAVTEWSLSPDGRLMAYSLAEAGSDQQVAKVLDTVTRSHLDDELHELRFAGFSWLDNGFFYSRFPGIEPGTTGLFKDMSVFFHEIGTSQDADPLVFANPDAPDLLYYGSVTDDHRFLVISEFDGTSHENGLLVRAIDDVDGEFTRVVDHGVASHGFLAHHDGHLLVQTNLDAPNGRVIAISVDDPHRQTEVIPEGARPIEVAGAVAGRIVMVTLEEASHRVSLHRLDGTQEGEIALPDLGTVEAITGRLQDPIVFIGFQSFLRPPSVLQWEEGVTSMFAESGTAVDPDDFIVERRHAVSSDGAEVGMFLIRHKSTGLPAPTEMYGYGGYSINVTPAYSPSRLAWMEAGGVVAVTNLRGGTENGEEWHRQGMLDRKQQTFDDFYACAEHLIESGVTTPGQLGIRGGSNGGLLTAVAMQQRPELFGAVVSHVPVTDMYRYQHFTAGRFWTVEYGDAATDVEAFRYLTAYSPLHNVEPGVEYPPLLVLTAETDDRVVPMHSHKLIAELQHAAGGESDSPLLERIETRAGHGLGKPTSKLIDEAADVYGFMLHHLS